MMPRDKKRKRKKRVSYLTLFWEEGEPTANGKGGERRQAELGNSFPRKEGGGGGKNLRIKLATARFKKRKKIAEKQGGGIALFLLVVRREREEKKEKKGRTLTTRPLPEGGEERKKKTRKRGGGGDFYLSTRYLGEGGRKGERSETRFKIYRHRETRRGKNI